MARDDEAKPRTRRSPEARIRKTPEAKPTRTQPNVDPSRATEATGAVAAIDAEGGDRAKSASRSRPASSRALPPEPNAGDYLNPSHDEVARRAYQRWRETGNEDAFDNWIQAERQLREEQLRREE